LFRFLIPFLSQAALMLQSQWAQSAVWQQSALQHGEWTTLPLPVLDCILRQALLRYRDLLAIALTCQRWRVAVCEKIPYTVEALVENTLRREQRQLEMEYARNKALLKRQAKERRRREMMWLRVKLAALTYCITLPCLVAGLTGLLYFRDLFQTVSVVPDCGDAYSLHASLYCCCAFWLLDTALLVIWSLSFAIPSHEERTSHPTRAYFHPRVKPETIFSWCNSFGIVSNIGVWSSAAACVHYSNACMSVYPSVALPTRAFAAVSLTFGIIFADFGLFVLSEA
jgi:hypothetical protein